MVSLYATWFFLLTCFFLPSIRARNLGRRPVQGTVNQGHLRQASIDEISDPKYTHEDTEALVLDFSESKFEDFSRPSSSLNFALSDPYKANPKNGTPWFRYTKTSGRGQANHSHFGGLSATGAFPDDILRAHNVVRERAGVTPLEWSSQLGDMASARVQKLAQQGCYIEHAPLSERWNKGGFRYVGENLYKVINMKPSGVDIVDAWYAEIEDYTYGLVGASCVKERCSGRSSPPCVLGHFTQVMWADSTHVGCARAECPGQAKPTFVSVCNYGPGGNIVGRYPFPVISSGKMGLAQQDCSMRRRKARKATARRRRKPAKLHSGAQHQASIVMALTSAALASLVCS